jgi:hypothetical protein
LEVGVRWRSREISPNLGERAGWSVVHVYIIIMIIG